ncbi:MAG: hypothetical protein ACK5WA_03705, partial [Alphaproteobacteria bacterium]
AMVPAGSSRHGVSCSRLHAAVRQKIHLSQLFRFPEPGLSSRAVEENLLTLTRALKLTKSQVALVIGAPGSGKDSFTKALHFGSVAGYPAYKAAKKREHKSYSTVYWEQTGLYTMSIAGISTEEFSSRLLTATEYSGGIDHDIISQLDEGGTIFIDEFDKPDSQRLGFYGFLLRILEAKEYVKIINKEAGSSKNVPARYNNINWILAGAFSQSDPRKTIPRDLWSRLDTFVRLRNPIERDPSYVATLFLHAYLLATVRDLGPSHEKIIAMLQNKGTYTQIEKSLLRRVLGYKENFELEDMAALLPTTTLLQLSERFSDQVRAHATYEGDPIDTARSVTKAGAAAFFALKNEALAKNEFDLCQSHTDLLPDVWKVALKHAVAVLEVSRGPG